MKIGILSRGRTLYSTRRIAEAGRRRGHDVRVLDPFMMSFGVIDSELIAFHDGLKLSGFDLIIPRIGVSITEFGLSVLRQFEFGKVAALNSSTSIFRSRDKYHALQALTAAGVPVPKTMTTNNSSALGAIVETLGGAPVVVKFNHGTQGVGVIVCESFAAVQSTVQALWSLDQAVTVQEYVAESEGRDVRVLVVDGKAVGAMRRHAAPGDFRSNLHRGGSAENVRITPELNDIAVAATRTLGLDVAGVDLLESNRGLLVLEVNSSPGLHGIEYATGENIADKVIECGENKAQRSHAA